MKDLFSLIGKKALVTGSSRGIGRESALALAAFGADVMVHGSSDSPQLRSARDEVRALGRRSECAAEDLGVPGAGRRLFEKTDARFGAPDIVVHNASVEIRRPWTEISYDEYRLQMDVNLWAGIELFQSAAPAMAAAGWGRIITIGSVQQRKPHPEMLVYAASKNALAGVVRGLARQLAGTGVTVNNIAPGAIGTDRTNGVLADPDYKALIESQIPLGFVGEPKDCAGVLLLLASEAGRYISGEDIFVDGLKNY